MKHIDKDALAKMIDHTKLSAHATRAEIATLCQEARQYGFRTVCVNSSHTRFASEALAESGVGVCTVVGFPLGASAGATKAFEARQAVLHGATEIDMVINVGAMRDKQFDLVGEDIRLVVEASHPALVKVILETCYLTNKEIVKACELSLAAGARFVKTSTGFGAFGAFPDHVRLMRQTVGPDFGVKASGGIRNHADAMRMIEAGANRLGTSGGMAIIDGMDQPAVPSGQDIPCLNCPSHYAAKDKLPKDVFDYYTSQCPTCPHHLLHQQISSGKTPAAY
jgi:deoxyribose-phosphate aldolase